MRRWFFNRSHMDYRHVHSECFLKRQFWGAHPLALDELTEMDYFFKSIFVFHRRKNGMALGWINDERIFSLGSSIPLRYGITLNLKRANNTSMTPSASFQVNRSLHIDVPLLTCIQREVEQWSSGEWYIVHHRREGRQQLNLSDCPHRFVACHRPVGDVRVAVICFGPS